MEKKVRMADIAQRLGISIVSVSKGLSGKDGVSEEMRGKIIAAAEEMGYVMPQPKKEEKTASGNIGILVADRFIADILPLWRLCRRRRRPGAPCLP